MEASRAAETLQQGLDDQAKSARGPMDLHNGAWLFISRGAALALLAERDELAKDAARYRLIRAGYCVLELLTPESRPEEGLNYRSLTIKAELNYGNAEEGEALDRFVDRAIANTPKD